MSDWNRIWRALIPLVLIVTVLVATSGMACHHHHDRSSADQCTLCHLVIAPTVANTGVCELTWAPADLAVQREFFVPGCAADHIPSRAPPA
jgi:hypothetical protein